MTECARTPAAVRISHDRCDASDATTRSLLGYGVIAGPVWTAVSLGQALTRDGFDLRRHQWSLLANGELGWLQTANFVVTGLMLVACAVGLRRSLRSGARGTSPRPRDAGATWAPRLVGAYGISLVAAGLVRADPALGFPVGTPDGPASVSWHGLAHLIAGGIGFACLAVACFVVARRYDAEARRGYARWSRLTGITFLAGFGMIASSGGSTVGNLTFTAAATLVWVWLSAVSLDRYRTVRTGSDPRPT